LHRFIIQSFGGLQLDNSIILEIANNTQPLLKVVICCCGPSHIGTKGNAKADAGTKMAFELNTSINKLPHSDFRHTLNSHNITNGSNIGTIKF